VVGLHRAWPHQTKAISEQPTRNEALTISSGKADYVEAMTITLLKRGRSRLQVVDMFDDVDYARPPTGVGICVGSVCY
jgi:hypothetical protein